jgi:hypothetical protein
MILHLPQAQQEAELIAVETRYGVHRADGPQGDAGSLDATKTQQLQLHAMAFIRIKHLMKKPVSRPENKDFQD